VLGGIKISLAEDKLRSDIVKEVICPVMAIARIIHKI
jgi:hypothetical protein